jgi:predicted nucleic acid-binding protein
MANKAKVLLDTGPLVAFLNHRDRYHSWAKDQLAVLEPPLHTCEAVLSEACFLLRHLPGGQIAVFDLVQRELVKVAFRVADEVVALRKLLEGYADLPISVADACLVRMAELETGSRVLTLDSDFLIYRIHGRRVIPTILPKS